MTKHKKENPPMPKEKVKLFWWFITYHTGKFIAIIVSLLLVIGFFATFNMVVKTNPKTGKKQIEEIQIKNIDVDVNVGKAK